MAYSSEAREYDLRFLDPYNYYRQLLELGEYNVAWSQEILHKRRIDPYKFMNLHFAGTPWNAYAIGNWSTQEMRSTDEYRKPTGVYPSWTLGTDSFADLQDFIENPWGQNRKFCADNSLPWYDRPVFNQPHRVFICGVNSKNRGEVYTTHAKKLLQLREIQLAYPEVELFLHGGDSFNVKFGLNFYSGDYNAFRDSQGNALRTPGGRIIKNQVDNERDMLSSLGFTISDIKAPGGYTSWNICAASYAARHWDNPTGLCREAPTKIPLVYRDIISPTNQATMPHSKIKSGFREDQVQPNDKIACDACSLWRLCTSYRQGSVCNMTGTNSKKLSDMALSRDAGVITDMLASIVSKQADRAERALDAEVFEKDLNPDIDKMLNNVFRNGVQLAKLRDPNLGRALIQINNNSPASIVSAANPRGMVAAIVGQLEAKGHSREDITEDMISEVMQENAKAIESQPLEAEVVEE